MGASNFGTIGTGKDMNLAYHDLCMRAMHENGHNSYNGTISTTHGFIDVDKYFPKGTTAKTKMKVMDRALCYEEGPTMVWDKTNTKWVESKRREVHWTLRQLSPLHQSMVIALSKLPASKWGPCLGATLNNKRYYFVGWAAE